MRWQILWKTKEGGVQIGDDRYDVETDLFDDGIWAQPGEPGFTTEHVQKHIDDRGGDGMFSFVGMSVVANPAMEEEISAAVHSVLAQIAIEKPVAEDSDLDAHFDQVIQDHAADVRAAVLRDMGVTEAAQ